jgi:sterol desaturase/sphingolipid hydroxylase (fatty acid hydroxylase superfamily)
MNWDLWLKILALLSFRYLFIAGAAFLFFYVYRKAKFAPRRIQPKFPTSIDYQREIGYSVVTLLIFAAIPTFILSNPLIQPHTTLYTDISRYGTWYFWAAYPLMAVMHDTYFYWTHRLMHHRKLFKYFHLVHHRSTNPSPWAAYAFHPLEAIVEAGIFVVFLFTIPIHPLHLFFFFLFMIVYNIYGHLGYELYPRKFAGHWLGKWINTSVSHNMHHQHFKQNYSLYFTFWDRVMGTMHRDYEEHFELATTSPGTSDEPLNAPCVAEANSTA